MGSNSQSDLQWFCSIRHPKRFGVSDWEKPPPLRAGTNLTDRGSQVRWSRSLAGPGTFWLFLPLLLPIKDGRKGNQLTPSKHFSAFNSILYWAVELFWFTNWRSALTEQTLFGWGFLTSFFFVFLCVVFFCRLFYFLNITTELLFEFLNYCSSNQGTLKASMETSYFLENFIENSPERAHGEIVFLQLQGMVTELVILRLLICGAGLNLGLVPLPTRLHQCQGGRALPARALLGTESSSVLLHSPFLCRARAAQGWLSRERGQGNDCTVPAAAHRVLFEQLPDSHVILAAKTGPWTESPRYICERIPLLC